MVFIMLTKSVCGFKNLIKARFWMLNILCDDVATLMKYLVTLMRLQTFYIHILRINEIHLNNYVSLHHIY